MLRWASSVVGRASLVLRRAASDSADAAASTASGSAPFVVSLNKVSLMGNCGREPTRKAFANGNAVVSFPLATSESFVDREGKAHVTTQWHTVSVYEEKLGAVVERIVEKGARVYVDGALRYHNTKNQDGTYSNYTEIVVQRGKGGRILVLSPRGTDHAVEASE